MEISREAELIPAGDRCLNDGELRSLLAEKGEVAPASEAHLASCARCQSRLDELVCKDETASLLTGFPDWERKNREVTELLAPIRDGGPPDAAGPVAMEQLRDLLASSSPHHSEKVAGSLGWLGSLMVRHVVGEGGMGLVLGAHDSLLDREVAVKILKPSLARYPDLAAQFFEEAKAVAAISHENIVPIHQVASIRSVPYLVMPLAHGDTLRDRLLREGRPDFHTALGLCVRITRGLAAAHAAGVLHRDVKPDNVLTQSREGNPYASVWLADFGLARRRGKAVAGGSHLIHTAGTPGYLAPEVAAGAEGAARSDLYALGALFEALVEIPRSPAWFRELVRSLREDSPARRPDSADAVLELLHKHERDHIVSSWRRRYLTRLSSLARRAALVVVPVGLLGSALDLSSGSRFTNATLGSLGFGGMQLVGKFGVSNDLAKVVARAESGDIIMVRGPGVYSTRGCVITGKKLTIEGSSADRPPEIHLAPEATLHDPLLRCRDDSSVTLRGLSLIHWPGDAASRSPLPPLIHQTGGALTVEDCELRRVKVGDNLRPIGILADEVGKISLTHTRLHLNRSILVSWQWRDGQPPPRQRPEISFIDCLVSGDRILLVTPGSVSGLNFQMLNGKANLNTLASFRQAPETFDFRATIRDSTVQTRIAFLSDFTPGDTTNVPHQAKLTVENTRLSHLGATEGLPTGLPWRHTPLFIEQTWMLIE